MTSECQGQRSPSRAARRLAPGVRAEPVLERLALEFRGRVVRSAPAAVGDRP